MSWGLVASLKLTEIINDHSSNLHFDRTHVHDESVPSTDTTTRQCTQNLGKHTLIKPIETGTLLVHTKGFGINVHPQLIGNVRRMLRESL